MKKNLGGIKVQKAGLVSGLFILHIAPILSVFDLRSNTEVRVFWVYSPIRQILSLLLNSVERNRHRQAEKKIGIIPRNKNLLYMYHPRVKAVKQT